MSDYLGNILERSFTPAPDVRPRLPSLFEPLSASVIDGPADPVPAAESVEAVHAPPSIVAAQPAYPPRAERLESPVREANRRQWQRTIRPAAAAARPNEADTGLAPASLPPVMPANGLEDVSPAATAQSLPRHPRAELGPAKSAFSPPSSRLGPAEGDDQALPGVVQPIEASSRPPLPALPERDIETLDSGEMAFRPLSDEAEPAGIIVRPSAPAREIAGRPDLAGRPGESASAPQAKPETLPSIQVTIGRVEVRAALPPAQPRAKPKREPEMSLETYLKRRFEGGHR